MRPVATLALALLATACATPSVTLLDNERGAQTGAVAVIDTRTGRDLALIDRANTRSTIDRRPRQRAIDPGRMSARDAALLADLPEPPAQFFLYFPLSSTDLIPESEIVLADMLKEVDRRKPGVDVQIIGHTDSVGGEAENDRLSLERAQQIREVLVRRGLDPARTRASGRGERDPAVVTRDGRSLEDNRRVEVLVR